MAKKKQKYFPGGVSPCGEARWVFLAEPQPPYEGKGEAHYKVTISLDPEDAKVKSWIEGLRVLSSLPGVPWKKDEENGMTNVTFKSQEPIGVVDSKGNPLPKGVWPGRGSILRVAYTPSEYTVGIGGLTLYLNKVQVIEMVEGFGGSVNFPKEEGGYVTDQASIHPAADGSAQPAEADEKSPF